MYRRLTLAAALLAMTASAQAVAQAERTILPIPTPPFDAQILRLNGYNTAMFGKHHNIPAEERSEAGPYDAWPTSLGFEYYFGFPQGDSDQYTPNLYRGISRVDPDEGKGKMLDLRFADDI